MKQSMQVLTSNNNDEWYTPPFIIEKARLVLGRIDLDPASNDIAQRWVRAKTYYTKDEPWHGNWYGRVWLNPPYGDTPAWVNRLCAEYASGRVSAALLLVNSAHGYKWYEKLWREYSVCCLRERLRFVRPDGTTGGQAKKAQTVVYFGCDRATFEDVFCDLGRIIHP